LCTYGVLKTTLVSLRRASVVLCDPVVRRVPPSGRFRRTRVRNTTLAWTASTSVVLRTPTVLNAMVAAAPPARLDSQLGITRYIVFMEPLASLPPERVADVAGPTLQRYMIGKLS
jgi:hypothetical protein